jgi:hypothetical protein
MTPWHAAALVLALLGVISATLPATKAQA